MGNSYWDLNARVGNEVIEWDISTVWCEIKK